MALQSIPALFSKIGVSQQSGSERGNYALVSTDGSTIDSNIASLPVLKSFNPKDDIDTPLEYSANNDQYPLRGGKHTASAEVEFMQQDQAVKMFYKNYGQKWMMIGLEEHKLDVNGICQMLFIPYALAEAKGDRTSPGLGMKQSFIVCPSQKEIAIKLSDWTAGFNNTCTVTASVSIPANTYMTVLTWAKEG
jgi:hypothetical protein